jgi:hypothetical protein
MIQINKIQIKYNISDKDMELLISSIIIKEINNAYIDGKIIQVFNDLNQQDYSLLNLNHTLNIDCSTIIQILALKYLDTIKLIIENNKTTDNTSS